MLLTTKVAQDTGISLSTFNNWKNGKYKPNMQNLFTLAKYFEVQVDDLLMEVEA